MSNNAMAMISSLTSKVYAANMGTTCPSVDQKLQLVLYEHEKPARNCRGVDAQRAASVSSKAAVTI